MKDRIVDFLLDAIDCLVYWKRYGLISLAVLIGTLVTLHGCNDTNSTPTTQKIYTENRIKSERGWYWTSDYLMHKGHRYLYFYRGNGHSFGTHDPDCPHYSHDKK